MTAEPNPVFVVIIIKTKVSRENVIFPIGCQCLQMHDATIFILSMHTASNYSSTFVTYVTHISCSFFLLSMAVAENV